MPIYEYECERCLLRFELKRSFGEDGRGYCPRCGSEARRLFSPIPIIFKGSGFYITDSRKGNNSPPGKGGVNRNKDNGKQKTANPE